MTVKERMLALRLLEKQENNPEFVKSIGVEVKLVPKAEAGKNE